MRLFLIAVLIALSSYTMEAQGIRNTIRGIVNDMHNKALPKSSLVLTRIKDSSFNITTLANEEGRFVFNYLDTGVYLLTVTNIGYKKYASGPIAIDGSRHDITLPEVLLQSTDARLLKDFSVKSKIPLVEQRIDRLVVNVDAFITNAGSNALEVLGKSPGVMASNDGDISLNGRGGVLVLIDNKPTYLSGRDLVNYLRSISSGMLDKIELMSNPPARYDASGRAVINIILKKSKAKGFNGALTAGYSQGIYWRTSDALNFNYRSKKFNLFSNMSYSHDGNYRDETYNRYYYNADGSPNSAVIMKSYSRDNSSAFNGRVGMDYFQTSKTTWGIVLNGRTRPRDETGSYASDQYDSDMKLDSIGIGYTKGKYKWKSGGVNLNFQHRLDSTGKEISADLDYIGNSSSGYQTSPNYVYDPDGKMADSNELIYRYPSEIIIYSAKADYTHPFKKRARFDAGLKSSWVRTDNSTEYYAKDGNILIQDDSKTNHFIYKENVNAAYVNVSKEWRRWGAQTGLRLENTISNGRQPGNAVIRDSSFGRKYTNLFPTLYLSYKLDSGGRHTLVLSYGRRVIRPNYQQLNPFLLYHDKYTYTAGNPYLNASYNFHIEFSYRYKHYFVFSPFYDRVSGIIFQTTQSLGNIFITRPENIANGHIFGFFSNVSLSPVKWWTCNVNVNLVHIVNRGSLYTEYLNQSVTSGAFNIINQIRLSKSFSAELSGIYGGRMIAGQTVKDPLYSVSAGMQKTIWKDKGAIRVKIDDIFHSLISHDETTNIQQATAFHTRETDSRVWGAVFSYRFGRQANARKRNHVKGGADDEEERANN